jgi:hypothetical protein
VLPLSLSPSRSRSALRLARLLRLPQLTRMSLLLLQCRRSRLLQHPLLLLVECLLLPPRLARCLRPLRMSCRSAAVLSPQDLWPRLPPSMALSLAPRLHLPLPLRLIPRLPPVLLSRPRLLELPSPPLWLVWARSLSPWLPLSRHRLSIEYHVEVDVHRIRPGT